MRRRPLLIRVANTHQFDSGQALQHSNMITAKGSRANHGGANWFHSFSSCGR